jgi:N-acetylneuraminic acid mutarotase
LVLALALLLFTASQGCIFFGALPIAAVAVGVGVGMDQDEEDEWEPAPTGPAVTGVWPTSGPPAGGTSIQVFGLRFQSGATVTIGGNPATNVNFVSDTEITCDTPAGTAGSADVTVTNPNSQVGMLAAGFTYQGTAPVITVINPVSAEVGVGGSVTITGSDFVTGATVTFGGTGATNVNVVSATSITCDVPLLGAGQVDVVVTNPNTLFDTEVNGFAYYGRLTISLGGKTPPDRYTWNYAPKQEVMQFHLDAAEEDVTVTSITFTHAGTGTPSTAITAVRLFRDVNGDGWYTAGLDTQIGSDATYSGTTVTFSGLTETVTTASPQDWLLVYEFAGTGGGRFIAKIDLPSDVFTTGVLSGIPVAIGGVDSQGLWRPMSTVGAPSARMRHVSIWTGSRLIIWGGWNGSNYLNDGFLYDPLSDSWSPISMTGAPSARDYATAVWTGSVMIVWGGHNAGTGQNDGAMYNPVSNTWAPVTTTGTPVGRWQHTAEWTGTRMIVWGGTSPSPQNTGGIYDPVSNSWTATSLTGAPSARAGHSSVWTGTRMIIWGGSGGTIQNTGAVFNPFDNSWKTMTLTGAPQARQFHAAEWTGERMILWGGSLGGSYTNTGAYYDPGTNTWTFTPTAGAPPGMEMACHGWTGSRMLVWGGWDGTRYNVGGAFNAVTAIWDATTVTACPAARRFHTSTWTDSGFIVWGGEGASSTALDSGGIYSPYLESATITIQNGVWKPTETQGAPTGRGWSSVVFTGSKIIVWSGQDPAYVNTGCVYDVETDSWTPMSTTGAPSGRVGNSLVWTGKEMLVWGGWNGSTQLSDGALYDPVADSWTIINNASAPSARDCQSRGVWTGKEMIVWGGSTSPGGGSPTDTGAMYSPSNDTWTTVNTTNAPSPRLHHHAVWTGREMLVWGGCSASGGPYLGNGGRFNPVTNVWTTMPITGAPSARSSGNGLWTGEYFWVWGGLNPGVLGNGCYFDPVAGSWSTISSTGALSPRYLYGQKIDNAHILGQDVILWGGRNQVPNYFNDGAIFSTKNNSWTSITTIGAPSARAHHGTAVTGSEYFVFGGDNNTPRFNTGGIYDPNLPREDTWTATSTTVPMSSRLMPVSVWTGKEMIVWGGRDLASTTWYGNGARYDPQTDTCTAMNNTNAPSVRQSASAVWTGSEMIVWGGHGPNQVNTGGRYDPVADTWVATDTITAPSARTWHRAVWTGSRMVVWGGNSFPNQVDTGGIYDPVADTWVSTSTTSAPAAREEHTAIWTGSRVIVWGGYGSSSYLNTGGIFDPAANTWSALTTVGAPSVRGEHSAVWTGRSMIVWGGRDASNTLNTGGEYDPINGNWTATPIQGAPSARRAWEGMAVFTGKDVIIWGGSGTTGPSPLGNGARLDLENETWIPLALSGAPSARELATSVWTGSEMIVVCGGTNGSASTSTGGRYKP